MPLYYYDTVFDSLYNPYYRYTYYIKKKKYIFTIPAGIDTVYRGKHISTVKVMQLLHDISYALGSFPRDIATPVTWYSKNNKFDKKAFSELQKSLLIKYTNPYVLLYQH
jgi:hypothetical protein